MVSAVVRLQFYGRMLLSYFSLKIKIAKETGTGMILRSSGCFSCSEILSARLPSTLREDGNTREFSDHGGRVGVRDEQTEGRKAMAYKVLETKKERRFPFTLAASMLFQNIAFT